MSSDRRCRAACGPEGEGIAGFLKNQIRAAGIQASALLKFRAQIFAALFIFTLITWFSGPGQSSLALPWSFVSKITNSKHQISNKSQIPNYKFQTGSLRAVGPMGQRQSDCFFCLGF
jgi:hypothetical protein